MSLLGGIRRKKPFDNDVKRFFSFVESENRGKWMNSALFLDFYRSKEFESPWVPTSISDVETFLAGLRFEKRKLLEQLPINLKM